MKTVHKAHAKTPRVIERLGRRDFFISLALAAVTFVLLSVWSYPGVYPGAYESVCVASGVRPAGTILPGIWNVLVGGIYFVAGSDAGTFLMKLFGRLVLAGIAMFVYGFLREMLAFIMKARPQRSVRRTLVMQLSAAIGTAMFICVEPVWTAGQFFSENTVLLGLTVGAMMFFFSFLRTGRLRYSYLCAVFLGLLSAETPMGLVLLLSFVMLNYLVMRFMPEFESPFFKPAIIAVGRWHMTFLFAFAMLFAIAVSVLYFIGKGGLGGNGLSVGALPLAYFHEWIGRAKTASAAGGWILWLGACLMPFVVSVVKFPEAADEENFLSYPTGIVFLFCGLLALSQGCSLPAFWFWTYFPVKSGYLLSIGGLILAITLAVSLTILGVDAMCRNHKAIARMLYGYEDDYDEGEAISRSLADRLRRVGVVAVPLICLVALVPGRYNGGTREMLQIIDDAIEETVIEAHDTDFMFSDGYIDPMLEVRARAHGYDLKCISLLSGGRRAVGLRLRAAQDDEDRFTFEYDAGMGLRSWIHDKPERLQNCSAQMGFDLWKRDGKPIPVVGGMVARLGGWDARELAEGIARSKAIAERIIALHRRGKVRECTDQHVRDVFYAVQWRIARMCLYRSDSEDLRGEVELSIADAKLEKELDKLNVIFQDIVRAMDRRNSEMSKRITPREGLQLALARADFNMANIYADMVLAADEYDADANFAKGMYFLVTKKLSSAEEFLRRCLVRKPKEPAVINNIAMIQLELGRLEEAQTNALLALELVPKSDAVKATCRQIEKAFKKRANDAAKPADAPAQTESRRRHAD